LGKKEFAIQGGSLLASDLFSHSDFEAVKIIAQGMAEWGEGRSFDSSLTNGRSGSGANGDESR
jgi:hypothetical protein